LRRYLAALDGRIYNMKGEQEAALKSIREDQKRISSLQAESLCPLCLQSLTDEYKKDLMREYMNRVTPSSQRQTGCCMKLRQHSR